MFSSSAALYVDIITYFVFLILPANKTFKNYITICYTYPPKGADCMNSKHTIEEKQNVITAYKGGKSVSRLSQKPESHAARSTRGLPISELKIPKRNKFYTAGVSQSGKQGASLEGHH